MTFPKAVLLMVLASVVMIACGGGSTPTTTTATTTTTTTTAGGETTPAAEPDAALVAQGEAAYTRICANCHGAGGGEGDGGPAMVNHNYTRERMVAQIREGSGGMRPIPVERLSDADLNAVLAYLTTIHAVAN